MRRNFAVEAMPTGKALTFAIAVVIIVLFGVLLTAKPAHAKTFTVNSTQDFTDDNPGDGVCDAISSPFLNPCTLRAAIQETNAFTGADTINLDIPDNPNITGKEVKIIKPKASLPTITEQVTINGYTQSGAKANTLAVGNNAKLKIVLSGANAPGNGLRIEAANSTIKGLVINDWSGWGVLISGTGATANKVRGNYIGTNAAGTAALRNSTGMLIFNAPTNIVGGATAAARNIISGNDVYGVFISDAGATGNKVQGNYIGTDKNGTADLGNSQSGVWIDSAPTNTVGGPVTEKSNPRNVISGNGFHGVYIVGNSTAGNKVQGNYIGTDASGTAVLGNSFGGVFIQSAPDNTIGGTTAAESNTISGNDGDGVEIFASATDNSILRNSIYSNSVLGIDLRGGNENIIGHTQNDPQDTDSGPNNLQNYPDITSATTSSGTTTIEAKLNSTPNKTFTIQFFSNPQGDPPEGKKFLGQKSVTTNANGNTGIFTFTPNQVVPVGELITATATDPNGNTSEFLVGGTHVS